MNELKVLVGDDREQIRSALRLFLSQNDCGEVVGEVANLDDLLEAVVTYQPDLLVLDWDLPGLQAHEINRYPLHVLRAVLPQMAIVAMSSHPESRANSLAAGVDCFASKAASPQQLFTIFRSVYPRSRLLVRAEYEPKREPALPTPKEALHGSPPIDRTGRYDSPPHYH